MAVSNCFQILILVLAGIVQILILVLKFQRSSLSSIIIYLVKIFVGVGRRLVFYHNLFVGVGRKIQVLIGRFFSCI